MKSLFSLLRVAVSGLCAFASVSAAPVEFDIPAQPAVKALQQFSRQAAVEVMFSYDDLREVQANALTGAHEPEPALGILLHGTGFSAVRTNPTRFVVRATPTGRVSGTIEQYPGGQPVAGAVVTVPGTNLAVRSSRSGRYRLSGVPAGAQSLALQAPGLLPVRVAELAVPPGEEISLRPIVMEAPRDDGVQLDEVLVQAGGLVLGTGATVPLDAVVVTPSRFGVSDAPSLTAATLTQADLKALPQLGEDLFRAIGRLPGLATTDYSAKFWVRGAPNHQVLARLDGATLLEPYHMKDVDGALAIVDIETVDRLELLSGGFTAEFGDRLGGVLRMETETHARERSHTTLGLSLTGIRATSRGAFGGGRGNWLVSGRMGYPDIAIDATGGDGEIKPRYYDLFGKVEFAPAPGHVISLHALHSDDTLEVREPGGERLDSSYGNDYVWARWRAEPGDRFKGETVLTYAALEWRREGGGLQGGFLPFELDDQRRLRQLALRHDATVLLSDRALLRGGFELQEGEADYRYHRLRTANIIRNGAVVHEPRLLDRALAPDGSTAGGYAAVRFQPQARLTLEPGLRYDRSDYGFGGDWSPRLNAALDLGRATVRAAWGRYRQEEGLHEIDVVDGESALHPAELAEHRVIGLETRLGPAVSLRAEAYQRITRNPRPHGENLINVADTLGDILADRVFLRPTHAEARGVELSLASRGRRAVSWSASYAWAETMETVNGTEVPRQRDQRNTVYLDLTWRPNPRWQFTAAWQYHTGWPTTEEIFSNTTLADGSTVVTRSFGPIYGARLPAYHRMDLRLTRQFALRDSTLRVFLDVFNAYDRKNVLSYDSSPAVSNGQVATRKGVEELFPLLPSVGIIWDF